MRASIFERHRDTHISMYANMCLHHVYDIHNVRIALTSGFVRGVSGRVDMGVHTHKHITVFMHISSRESVLFIGTQFSILYTFMYSPAEAATPRA